MAYNKNDFLAGVIAGRALHGRHIGANGAPVHVEGTIDITENGTYDVTNYEQANVQVPHKQFTVDQILEGTNLTVPNINAGIDVSVSLDLAEVTDTYADWDMTVSCRSYYIPQEENDFIAFLLPPCNTLLSTGDSGKTQLLIPSLSGEYHGEYTYTVNDDMTDCGILIEEYTGSLDVGIGYNVQTDRMYTLTLAGSGWTSRTMYLVFDMLVHKRVMLGVG